MSVFKYKSMRGYESCEVEEKGEAERYPELYMAIDPRQLNGIEVGGEVTVMVTGKVISLRQDSDDTYGTGANITISMRSSEVKNKKESDFIDSMIDGE